MHYVNITCYTTSDADRLYVSRPNGVGGLLNIADLYKRQIITCSLYLQRSTEKLMMLTSTRQRSTRKTNDADINLAEVDRKANDAEINLAEVDRKANNVEINLASTERSQIHSLKSPHILARTPN